MKNALHCIVVALLLSLNSFGNAQPSHKESQSAESSTVSLASLYGKAYETERDRLVEMKGISRKLVPPAKGAPAQDPEQQALAEILLGWVRGAPTLRAALEDIAQTEQKALRQGGGLAPDPQKLATQLSRKHGARRMSWLAVELLWKAGDDWAGEAPESFAGPDARPIPGQQLRKLCAIAMVDAEATPLHAAILLECLRKEADPVVAEALRHVIAAHGDKATKALLASIVATPSSPLSAIQPQPAPAVPTKDAWKAASSIVVENYKVDRVNLEEAIRQLNVLVKKHAETKTAAVPEVMLLMNKQKADTYELSRSLSVNLQGRTLAQIVQFLCALSGHTWRSDGNSIVIYTP